MISLAQITCEKISTNKLQQNEARQMDTSKQPKRTGGKEEEKQNEMCHTQTCETYFSL